MKQIQPLLFALLILFCAKGSAQIAGNQIYGNNGYHNSGRNQAFQSVISTDSTLVVSARILVNKQPDFYMVSLGISQEAETVKKSLQSINARIEQFSSGLNALGVDKEDYYVDFISQAKIYDYQVSDQQAQQYVSGFEVKKNIMVKLNTLDQFDQLIALASEYDIYDIVKVDYRNNNIPAIYKELYSLAEKVIEEKRNIYLETNTNNKVENQHVIGERFYSVYPNTQYKKYEAFESAKLSAYTNSYPRDSIKKELRKVSTYYYEGVDVSGFDQIIESDNPTVGIQYIFNLSIFFEVEH